MQTMNALENSSTANTAKALAREKRFAAFKMTASVSKLHALSYAMAADIFNDAPRALVKGSTHSLFVVCCIMPLNGLTSCERATPTVAEAQDHATTQPWPP